VLIQARGLTIGYGSRPPVLVGVDLDLAPGERVALLGRSGAGKSSLALALAGLTVPAAGGVAVDGFEASDRSARRAVGSLVGLLFQSPETQLLTSRVADEIALGLENLGWSPGRIGNRVMALLNELSLGPLALRQPRTLSGGEMQRVALACAMAPEPRYLLLDEPTAHLDPETASEIEQWIDAAVSRAGALRLTLTPAPRPTPDPQSAPTRLIVVDRGQVAHDGGPALAPPLLARLSGSDESIEAEALGELSPRDTGSRLEARGLSVGWGGQPVLAGVDLALEPGAMVSLRGPTGSGKSTLLLTLGGLLPPVAGSVSLVPTAPLGERASCVVQFAERLFYRPTVREELAEWSRGPDDAVAAALELLRLPEAILDRSPVRVSGGEVRRLALVAGLLARRPLLLLDEPGIGLDGPGRRALIRLIRSFAAAGGSLLLAGHDEELLALGDVRLRIDRGSIVPA
jgi:energy-coupling factor transport system ATP-binding protein